MVPNAAALRLGLGMPRIIHRLFEKTGVGKTVLGVDLPHGLGDNPLTEKAEDRVPSDLICRGTMEGRRQ